MAANGATIAIYATDGGDTFPVDVRRTFGLNLRYQFLLLYTLDPALLTAAAQDVTAAVAAGALRAGEKAGLPLHHYPLDGDTGGRARRGRAGRGRQGPDRHRLTAACWAFYPDISVYRDFVSGCYRVSSARHGDSARLTQGQSEVTLCD